jgi:hypothetical protein
MSSLGKKAKDPCTVYMVEKTIPDTVLMVEIAAGVVTSILAGYMVGARGDPKGCVSPKTL